MNFEEVYLKIINDSSIRKIYDEIETKEKNDLNRWAYHNYSHIIRVNNMVSEILQKLNYQDDTLYKAKIAAYLHDVGAIDGKEGHAERSYIFAKKYFKDNNIEDVNDILDAIRYHSEGFNCENIIRLALIFSDKIDIQKDRFTPSGALANGNRQYTHILNIELKLENNKLIINFITDGNMDIEECNDFYFTKKIFKAIISFSEKINYEYQILLDNKKWGL